MNHPKAGIPHCLPAGKFFLLRHQFYAAFGYTGHYLVSNADGNLSILDKDGNPVGIIDFTGDGTIEVYEDA